MNENDEDVYLSENVNNRAELSNLKIRGNAGLNPHKVGLGRSKNEKRRIQFIG